MPKLRRADGQHGAHLQVHGQMPISARHEQDLACSHDALQTLRLLRRLLVEVQEVFNERQRRGDRGAVLGCMHACEAHDQSLSAVETGARAR